MRSTTKDGKSILLMCNLFVKLGCFIDYCIRQHLLGVYVCIGTTMEN